MEPCVTPEWPRPTMAVPTGPRSPMPHDLAIALKDVLGLALTPLLGEPCQTRFKWSTSEVMVDECGVDAEGSADPDRYQVLFKGVTDKDGVWTSANAVVAVARDALVMP